MTYDDELEEFRLFQAVRKQQKPIDEAFTQLERILENPFTRGYDSAFRVMARCLIELKREVDKQ